jgi:hypothetical protein
VDALTSCTTSMAEAGSGNATASLMSLMKAVTSYLNQLWHSRSREGMACSPPYSLSGAHCRVSPMQVELLRPSGLRSAGPKGFGIGAHMHPRVVAAAVDLRPFSCRKRAYYLRCATTKLSVFAVRSGFCREKKCTTLKRWRV